jgi:hypothetical protein
MTVDIFTKEEFEAALPTNKSKKNTRMWKCLGLVDGEYTYIIPIQKKSNDIKLHIVIRSSVGKDGKSASAGEDSIRVYLMAKPMIRKHINPKFWIAFGKAKKVFWITRVPGWEGRLMDHLREVYVIGKAVRKTVCPDCGKAMPVCISKSEKNKGRRYQTCFDGCGYFRWLENK